MTEFFIVIAFILCISELLQKIARRSDLENDFDGDGSGYDQYADTLKRDQNKQHKGSDESDLRAQEFGNPTYQVRY